MQEPVRLRGRVAARGLAEGRLVILPVLEDAVPRRSVAEPSAELGRLDTALAESRDQIEGLLRRSNLVGELQAIFEAQLLLLEDPALQEDVRARIQIEGINAEWALAGSLARFKTLLSARGDAFFQERQADVEDVIQRVIANLMGIHEGDLRAPFMERLPPGTVLAANDLPPSLLLRMGSGAVGIALEHGGMTSHTVVLARNRGVPALVGVKGLLEAAVAGAPVLLDARRGELILFPAGTDLARLRDPAAFHPPEARDLPASPLSMADGTEIAIFANMDRREDFANPLARLVSGTGLFRTEFLYMREPALLDSVGDQAAAYRGIIASMGDRPVTFRLLDIGADKSVLALGGFGSEARETVGADRRGLAFLLEHRTLLENQLEAILRAAEPKGETTRILLPMVRTLAEAAEFFAILNGVRERLRETLHRVPVFPVGAMLETPAAALMADSFSRRFDFLSIGSNDLARQLLHLEEGGNNSDENFFWEPAVLRMIDLIVRGARVPLTLCGDLAALPEMLPVLIGLGLRQFSLALAALPRCLPVPGAWTLARCQELAETVLASDTALAVRELLERSAAV